jgi:hypothetical protein
VLTRVLKSLRSWDLLFVAAVVIALGFLAWWPFDVVQVRTKGIKWTDLVVAFGIPVTIVITAVFALHQLREAEKSPSVADLDDLPPPRVEAPSIRLHTSDPEKPGHVRGRAGAGEAAVGDESPSVGRREIAADREGVLAAVGVCSKPTLDSVLSELVRRASVPIRARPEA